MNQKVKDAAKDFADYVDSSILVDIMKAQKMLDDQPVPLFGRWYYDFETDSVKQLPISVKQ